MIDDKKIEEAAFEETFGMYGEGESLESVFIRGAKWMQEEFLKDLWHPASEEPVEDKPFLAQEIGRWRVGVNSPLIPNNGWSTQRKIRGIKRWLYVKDLLPKTQKGGNHD